MHNNKKKGKKDDEDDDAATTTPKATATTGWQLVYKDDEDDSYNGKFNPNFIYHISSFNSNSTHLIFIILLLSPTNKDDGIGDIFRNNDLALRQTDSTEGVDDDDDPWLLTDGKHWFLYFIY